MACSCRTWRCAVLLGCMLMGLLHLRGATTFSSPASGAGGRSGLQALHSKALPAAAPSRGTASAATDATLGNAAGFVTGLAAAVCGLAVALGQARGRRGEAGRTSLCYTTQEILPSLTWLKSPFSGKDLARGETRVVCLAGLDICIGRTEGGKLFALGDKAPPTGISFSVGAEVQGETIVEPQYGSAFDCATGMPVGDWCPEPPVVGKLIGAFMGGPQAVATFDIREAFLSGGIEVLVDTNAKKAYEADYWKGVLDAQGKNDGTYY